jgi:ABC-type histidine transport system ATPase subunit
MQRPRRAVASRVAFHADGTIVEQGPPAELLGSPGTSERSASWPDN